MGSKKKIGQARRAWETKISHAARVSKDIDGYIDNFNRLVDEYGITSLLSLQGAQETADIYAAPVFNMWHANHRVTYDIDPTLYSDLINSDLPDGQIPIDILARMPHNAPLVLLPKSITVMDDVFDAFVVVVVEPSERHQNAKRAILMIWIGHAENNPTDVVIMSQSIALGKTQGEETFESYFNRVDMRYFPQGATESVSADKATMQEIYQIGIQVMLYLTSDKPDMEEISPPVEVRHKQTNRSPKIVNVGWRIGAALTKARAKTAAESVLESGHTVAPHVRRAHWHRYWVGPLKGDRKVVVKWIPPIEVNIDKGEIQPTIRPVKVA